MASRARRMAIVLDGDHPGLRSNRSAVDVMAVATTSARAASGSWSSWSARSAEGVGIGGRVDIHGFERGGPVEDDHRVVGAALSGPPPAGAVPADGDASFSAIIRCELDGFTVIGSRLHAGPFPLELGVKVHTAQLAGGRGADRMFCTHHAVIVLDGATAFEPVDVDPATYADTLGRPVPTNLTTSRTPRSPMSSPRRSRHR